MLLHDKRYHVTITNIKSKVILIVPCITTNSYRINNDYGDTHVKTHKYKKRDKSRSIVISLMKNSTLDFRVRIFSGERCSAPTTCAVSVTVAQMIGCR